VNAQTQARQPIASVSEAQQAIVDLGGILDRLAEAISDETKHVRAGHIVTTTTEAAKAELARAYTAESMRIAAARQFVAGIGRDAAIALRERHVAFQQLLHMNLTVLATAHAVSEGIIRGVSGELSRQRAPQTYGASGRATAPSPRASQPLAISRKL